MMYKGVVKDNVVIVEEGVYLPNGASVVVIVDQVEGEKNVTSKEVTERQALVARMKAFGQRLEGRDISLGDLILEGRKELEDCA
jgi:hypothetical protein